MGRDEILESLERAKYRMGKEQAVGLSEMMAIMAALGYIIRTLGKERAAGEPAAGEERAAAEGKQAATVSPQNKKEKAKKEAKTDYGKIAALYKAGWTQYKIADEMGTSQTVISVALKRYNAKLEAGYIWDAETRSFLEEDKG